MRRLALLAFLGTLAAAAQAETAPAGSKGYLRLRAQNHIEQSSVPAALREVEGTRVLEFEGKVVGTCQSNGAAQIIFEFPDRDTETISAKALPAWLDEGGTVRVLVLCERTNGQLRATLLAAAPAVDVLRVEEDHFRRLEELRLAGERRASINRPVASRGGSSRPSIYGRIGGRSYSAPGGNHWTLPPNEVVQHYAAFIRGRNRRLTASEALRIAQAVVGFSLRYKIPDMRLVMAVLMVESGFNPNAVSRAGAVGLGQLMPGTARGLGVRNSYDAVDNLAGAIKLLAAHLNAYGTVDENGMALALAAYNAGPGAVKRHGGVPPYRETQAYVRRVMAYYNQFRS